MVLPRIGIKSKASIADKWLKNVKSNMGGGARLKLVRQ